MTAAAQSAASRDAAGQIDSVDVAGVTKRYGLHRALAGVELTLRAGALCALLGPNGAGKSTLLGILSTLVRPTAGEVRYRSGGRTHGFGPGLRRRIGVLAHEPFIYGELTGSENLAFFSRLYDVPDARRRASALLDEVGLDDDARSRPARTYSRGMRQRLALARALLHDPQVLLFDEPFTGLDRAGAEALARTLERGRQSGRVALIVTHDLGALDGRADHVVVLRRGKVAHEERYSGGVAAGVAAPDVEGIYRDGATTGFSAFELEEIYRRHCD